MSTIAYPREERPVAQISANEPFLEGS